MEDRIVVLMSNGDHILKEIHVHTPQNREYFEKNIKSSVEGQNFGSFGIKKIICPADARFTPYEYEDFSHYRFLIEVHDYKTRK
jgi:hypothetical protein